MMVQELLDFLVVIYPQALVLDSQLPRPPRLNGVVVQIDDQSDSFFLDGTPVQLVVRPRPYRQVRLHPIQFGHLFSASPSRRKRISLPSWTFFLEALLAVVQHEDRNYRCSCWR